MSELILIAIWLPAVERYWLRKQAIADFASINGKIIKAVRGARIPASAGWEGRIERESRRLVRGGGA